MNAPRVARDKARPVFTDGSLIRHVAVMTATGAIGLTAVFSIDLLSLFWVSRLGDQAYKAAVGYVGLATFFAMSITIGLTIAASATVSRALGAGDRPRGRQLAASALTITAVISSAVAALMFVFRDWGLTTLLHASGEPLEVASKFLAITLPANVPMALGMAMSGLLRAVGDARRAMYVTLTGAIVTAILDPLLIFGFGLGVYGAAWAGVAARLSWLYIGWRGAVQVHDIVARPNLKVARGDFGPIMAIGFPAIMANLATPVGSAYTVRVFSDIGEAAIAAGAIIDRVTPVAFAIVFALTGSIGPIIGQNYGARQMGRVQRALTNSFLLAIGYVLVAWAALAFAAPWLVSAFDAKGDSAAYVIFYCRYGVVAWLFLACLFVANTAFNNLGFPVLSMAFNWGRATLGTIPFVTLGAHYDGVRGGLIGVALGCAVFGLIAVAAAYAATARLAKGIEVNSVAASAGPGPGGTGKGEAMTLSDIVQAAQGGKAVDNLAAEFGVTAAQTQGALEAMMPAFAQALKDRAAEPAALGGLLTEMASGAHAAAYSEPGQAAGAGVAGAGVLGQMFGSPEAIGKVAQHVAEASGVSPETIAAMLPAIASMLTGGLAHSLAAGGHSGALSELAGAAAAPGGLGSALGAEASGAGGRLGSLMSSIFGGSREPANPQAAALVAGLASLSAMFVAGVQASQAQQAGMNAAAQSFLQPPPSV